MARTVTADAEDFARLSFRLVEERGSGGTWFAARDLLEAAASAHPAHPFVRALAEKPGRRIVFSAAAERVRRSEFAHIERRRRGTRRNAAVSYRLTRPMLVGGGAGRTAPQAALGPTPQPSTPGTCVGGLPACVPGADRGISAAEAGRIWMRTTLRDLRRRLEASAGEQDTWRTRLLEPLLRLIARLQAAVVGR